MIMSNDLLDSMMLNRAEARARNLFHCAGGDYVRLLQCDTISINHSLFENPINLIRKVRQDRRMRNVLRPRYKSQCVHGDLTFLNMVLSDQQDKIIMIDPRGYSGDFDVLYDFGKMKFSLSGFADIVLSNYDLSLVDGRRIIVGMPGEHPNIKEANADFLRFLAPSKSFRVIRDMEPYWNERIRFYEAINYLADIPFRLHTDSTPYNSIMCFLWGTIYLNAMYRETYAKTRALSDSAWAVAQSGIRGDAG